MAYTRQIDEVIKLAKECLPELEVVHHKRHPYDDVQFRCKYKTHGYEFRIDSFLDDHLFNDAVAGHLLDAIKYFEDCNKGRAKPPKRLYNEEDYADVTNFGVF